MTSSNLERRDTGANFSGISEYTSRNEFGAATHGGGGVMGVFLRGHAAMFPSQGTYLRARRLTYADQIRYGNVCGEGAFNRVKHRRLCRIFTRRIRLIFGLAKFHHKTKFRLQPNVYG